MKIGVENGVASYIRRFSVPTGAFSAPLEIAHYYASDTTNNNGDLTIAVHPNYFLGGVSLTTGLQCSFRASGDGTLTVAHFTDTSNQNASNTEVSLRANFFREP